MPPGTKYYCGFTVLGWLGLNKGIAVCLTAGILMLCPVEWVLPAQDHRSIRELSGQLCRHLQRHCQGSLNFRNKHLSIAQNLDGFFSP